MAATERTTNRTKSYFIPCEEEYRFKVGGERYIVSGAHLFSFLPQVRSRFIRFKYPGMSARCIEIGMSVRCIESVSYLEP